MSLLSSVAIRKQGKSMLAEAKGIPDPYRCCEAGLGALPVGPMPLSSESIVGNLLCSCILDTEQVRPCLILVPTRMEMAGTKLT